MDYDIKALMGTLNPQCRQSLEEAAALCVAHGHYSIEIEHFMMKLLERRNTDIDRILTHFGLTRGDLRRDLENTLDTFKCGNKRVPTFAQDVPKLLKEAWLVASLQMHSGRVRSGAIFLVLRLDEDLKDRMLLAAPCLRSIDPEMLWRDLEQIIRNSNEAQTAAMPVDARPPDVELAAEAPQETPALDAYTLDLTAKASQGKIDPVIGRESEIRQIIDILGRRRQNNPILTGEAGVGKTAVVEGLARRIVNGEVPTNLRNVSLRMLDLTLLQAGASVQGEFEKRLKSIITEVKGLLRPVILFIDEAHMLIGAGGNAGISDAANILKPALARGELRTIAATTWAEYKRYFESDSALARRFQVVKVEEPVPSVAVEILRGLLPHLERHHKVRITDDAVRQAVRLASRYMTDRHLPDNAISILDTAGARVAMAQRSMPGVLEDANQKILRLKEEIAQLEREQQSGQSDHSERLEEVNQRLTDATQAQKDLEASWQNERRLVERIRVVEDRLEQGIGDEASRASLAADRESLAKLQKNGAMVPLVADAGVVSAVVAEWTGIPLGQMHQDEISAVLDLEKRLSQKVIGQRLAVDTITRRIRTARAGLDDPGRPLGVFFLAGPSGVGKTEMGHAVADVLFGSERSLVVINMSEYQEAHTISQLKGAPPGYVGHGQGGILTEAVRRHPFSVVLLDEIEKAHPDVLELFFQVFDKGTLEDGEGVVVDFRHTVILMASNLAGDEIEALCEEGRADDAQMLETVSRVLDGHFPAALLGRVVVIPFGPLSHEDLCKIAELKLIQVRNRFDEAHHAQLSWTSEAVDTLAAHCVDSKTGARQLDRLLGHDLLPSLSSLVLERMVDGEPINDISLEGIDENRLALRFVIGGGEAILTLASPSLARHAHQDEAPKSAFERALQADEARTKRDNAKKLADDSLKKASKAPLGSEDQKSDTREAPLKAVKAKDAKADQKVKTAKAKDAKADQTSNASEESVDAVEASFGREDQNVDSVKTKFGCEDQKIDSDEVSFGSVDRTVDAPDETAASDEAPVVQEKACSLRTASSINVKALDAKIAEILATHEISLDDLAPKPLPVAEEPSESVEEDDLDDDESELDDDETQAGAESADDKNAEEPGMFGRFFKLFH